MNFNWSDASSLLDLWDHALIGLILIAVTAIPSWFAARNHRAIRSVDKKTDSLTGQISNGHAVPLRMDVDRVIKAVDEISVDVRGLRQDLAMEEDRRRSAVADLYNELDHRTGRHRRQED